MEKPLLKNRIDTIIHQVSGVQIDAIEEKKNSLTALGIDSIGLVTLICIIEDEFGITLSNQNLFEIADYQDFIDFVYNQIEKSARL